jgi:hypothetical protein
MVAAVVGAFGASGALAYFLYHPHQVNHPRCCSGWSIWGSGALDHFLYHPHQVNYPGCCSGWSIWGLWSSGPFPVPSTPGKPSLVLQWLEPLGLRSSGLYPVPSTPGKPSLVLQWLEPLRPQELWPISCTIHTR